MIILVTSNNEEDPIKTKGARVIKTFFPLLVYGNFIRRSRAANSAVRGLIGLNFEFIRDFMVGLFTCKNEEDPIKHKGLECERDDTSMFQTLRGR